MEFLKFLITFVVLFAIIYPLAQKNRKKREANAPQVSPAFEANVRNISEALVRASAAEAGRNMPANYLMDSSSVRLS